MPEGKAGHEKGLLNLLVLMMIEEQSEASGFAACGTQ